MERKNTGWKILVCFLLIIILAMGGFILYDKVLKDKYFSKDKTKETDNNNKKDDNSNTDNSNNKIISGKLDFDYDAGTSSEILTVNGKDYTLTFNFIEDVTDGSFYGPGREQLLYNNKIIYTKSAAEGMGEVSYYIFSASDNKEYVLLYIDGMMDVVFILNENGEILKEVNNYIDNYTDDIRCLFNFKNDENKNTVYIEDGVVYYFKYNSIESKADYTVKMDKIKIEINNNLITETKTGEQEVMILVNCV